MTTLFIQPMDVWLFRDGRPFDAGSANRAESLFPPYPTVLQGAFRTHKLVLAGINLGDSSKANKEKIAELVGGADTFGSLKLRGPYLARQENGKLVRYFPQPADAIVEKDKITLHTATPDRPRSTLKTSQFLPFLFGQDQVSGKQDEPLWLGQDALVKYLSGEPVKGVEAETLFVREGRTGIGMNASRVVEEGMLYETSYIRPCDGVGLLVEMEGYNEPEWQRDGTMYLGGEKRMAYFKPENVETLPAAPEKTGHFKIYFATPTYFENGWLPTSWANFFADPVTLLGAAVNRYETLGGFNWIADPNSANAHRPSRRFVPAGSVYYFKGNDQLVPNLPQQAVTDFGAEIGFGQIIIKEW